MNKLDYLEVKFNEAGYALAYAERDLNACYPVRKHNRHAKMAAATFARAQDRFNAAKRALVYAKWQYFFGGIFGRRPGIVNGISRILVNWQLGAE